MNIRNNLSIIADVATVLGVSIAGFIGTPLVSNILDHEFSFFDFMTGVLLYFVVTSTILVLSSILIKRIWNAFKVKKYIFMVWYFFIFIAFLTVLTGLFGPLRDLWANIFGNEYFFPKAPDSIIEKISLRFDDNGNELEGKVIWKAKYEKPNIDDYRILTYLKYRSDYFYDTHRFIAPIHGGGTETELASISADSSFIVPGIKAVNQTQGNVLQGIIAVVVTRLDGSLRRRYPAGIPGKNAAELKRIGAFAEVLRVGVAQPGAPADR